MEHSDSYHWSSYAVIVPSIPLICFRLLFYFDDRYKYQVICKYVRREIRTLSDTDREKYFYTLKQFHR